jgi:hypothetical protein
MTYDSRYSAYYHTRFLLEQEAYDPTKGSRSTKGEGGIERNSKGPKDLVSHASSMYTGTSTYLF